MKTTASAGVTGSGKSRNAVIWFFLVGQSDAQRWPIGLIAVSGWAADLVTEW